MRFNLTSKKVLAVSVAATLLTGGIAYAFWTGGGSGTGTAPTASGAVALTVNQATVVTPLYPGLAAQTLSGTFGNSGTAPVYVTSVTVSMNSVTDGLGAAIIGCTVADYTLANPVMTVNQSVAVGSPVGAWTGATIQFDNDPVVNQDACKSATVNLAYVVA